MNPVVIVNKTWVLNTHSDAVPDQGPYDTSVYDSVYFGVSGVSDGMGGAGNYGTTTVSVFPGLIGPDALTYGTLGSSASITGANSNNRIQGKTSAFFGGPAETEAGSVEFPNFPTTQSVLRVQHSWSNPGGSPPNAYPITISFWMLGVQAHGQISPTTLVNKAKSVGADGSDALDATGMDYVTLKVSGVSAGVSGMNFQLETLGPDGVWFNSAPSRVYGGITALSEKGGVIQVGPKCDYLSSGDATTGQQTQGASVLLPSMRVRWGGGANTYPATFTYSVTGTPYSA